MTYYSYECDGCEETEEIDFPFGEAPSAFRHAFCGGLMRHVLCFVFHKPMREHYNPTLGRRVRGQRDFRDGLKRASEAATLRTGTLHDYQPVDLNDEAALGVTEDGREENAKMRRDTGLVKPSSTIIIP